MKTSILYLTEGGGMLASRIEASLKGSSIFNCRGKLQEVVRSTWDTSDAIIFIMATGIVVRSIASLLKDKYSDPAVVVCDERGRFAISLLSGHAGGANSLATRISEITGGRAVITTASDVLGHTAFDLWATKQGLVPSDRAAMTRAMGKLVNIGKLRLWSSIPIPELPLDIEPSHLPENADVIITFRQVSETVSETVNDDACILHAPVLFAGIGCNRGTSAEQIGHAVSEAFSVNGLALQSLAAIGTIDLKKDETGLVQFAHSMDIPLLFFTKDQLNSVAGCSFSKAAMKATGAQGVAEPAALLASCAGKGAVLSPDSGSFPRHISAALETHAECNAQLIVRKMKWKDVTVAVALDTSQWWEQGLEPQTW